MTISARWSIFSYPTLMQPVRALQSTGKSKACFTWHYAFVKNSLPFLDRKNILILNDKYIPVYNAYSGQTETMQAKWANLKKMEEETFAKIIMGKADISEFDTFVENWKNQGGDQILKEINEELNNSSGN